jgi:hypothetical protein
MNLIGRHTVYVRFSSLVAASLALVACANTDSTAPAAAVRDSAGIAIVEHAYADSAALTWWALEPSPVIDIGGAEVEESYSLYQVSDALPLPDGGIVLVNGGSADVRYYDAAGTHVRTSGRRGEGPGEFQRPQRLIALPGDSMLVVDGMAGRASVLDPDGVFARDFRVGSGPGVGAIGRLEDGNLVATQNMFMASDIVSGFQRNDIAFVTITPTGELLDTIVSVAGAERTIEMNQSAGQIRSIMISSPPFSKSTVYAANDDALVVATQESPEIRVYGSDGALRRIIRTGTPMPAVTEAHLDAWHERSRQAMTEEQRQQALTRPEWPDAGKVVPPFQAIAIDDAGNLWAADYDDRIHTPGTWSVYDAEGGLIARIRMPEGFRLLYAGEDFVIGVERDEYDVELVRMYRVMRE